MKDEETVEGSVEGEVCRIEDSPYRIMKTAASGNLREFTRLYELQPSRIHLQDVRGQTVLHHACSRSRSNIIEFIIEHDGGLNTKDKKGNTALHVAIELDQHKAVEMLLTHGANPHLLNHALMTPLHAAVYHAKDASLKVLLEHSSLNVNRPGEQGQTALHVAATRNNESAATELMKKGASLWQSCDMGFYPVHTAAKAGAAATLDAMLQYASAVSMAEKLLTLRDKDKNCCLHAAVDSGQLEAVRVCVKHKSPLDIKQHDGASALHLACAHGSLEMVKVLVTANPDMLFTIVCLTDGSGMTPLHRAAVFDHEKIAGYLAKEGADVDARDSDGRTPLLVAADNHAWRTIRVLLQNSANLVATDSQNRNFLHIAILNGVNLHELSADIYQSSLKLLNEVDDHGCTPLHYASKDGHLSTIEQLIHLGAFLNVKNKDKQAPLHFAARYGRLNTCVRLLGSEQGSHIINETDGEGLTALHLASHNGHSKIVELLLSKGALLHRDHKGNTPLHLAAENGYTQTMKLLLRVHGYILNEGNKNGETALHLAAQFGHVSATSLLLSMNASFLQNNDCLYFLDYALENKHKDVAHCVLTHDRWQEVMDLPSCRYGYPMIGLIQQLPEVCLSVLDQCQTTSVSDTNSKDFYYQFDFRYLQSGRVELKDNDNMETVTDKKSQMLKEVQTPMLALNVMVQFNRVECLSHPVCVHFLKMKWRAYGFFFHMVNIGVYAIFLAFLTFYVCTINLENVKFNADVLHGNHTDTSSQTDQGFDGMIGGIIICTFCFLNMIKEMLQMLQQGVKYFHDLTNLLEWILYLTSCVFILPCILHGGHSKEQLECGAIAVFLAWFNLLLYLQRFDIFGIYVVMFLEILKTLIQVIVVFSILIIAFGLSFYILLSSGHDVLAHKTPLLSLMRSFVMMLGEIDYISTFVNPLDDGDPLSLPFSSLTFITLVVFILLMPILLMNLLIGLAVGDIEAVQRNAQLKRLAMQVELHTDLEGKIPKRILRYANRTTYRVYPSCYGSSFFNRLLQKFTSRAEETNKSQSLGREQLHQTAMTGIHTHMLDELYKQKRRMKELSGGMEKQTELLRLIVEKMEIPSEAGRDGEVTDGKLLKLSARSPILPPIGRQRFRNTSMALQWTSKSLLRSRESSS